MSKLDNHDAEALEKARQEVMRFKELLDVAEQQFKEGATLYDKLFAQLTEGERMLPEKERQRIAASAVLKDASTLKQATLHMQFVARNLERDFEELYGIILENS